MIQFLRLHCTWNRAEGEGSHQSHSWPLPFFTLAAGGSSERQGVLTSRTEFMCLVHSKDEERMRVT